MFCGGREATGRGGGTGGGGASVGLDEDTWHIFSAQATRTQGPLADRLEGRVTLHAGSVQKLLPLLQPQKLIFQASKSSTNFYVDTRNQEQPIMLGIGRKSIVDLK